MSSLRSWVVPGTAPSFGWMSKITERIRRRASSNRRSARRACQVVVTIPAMRLAAISRARHHRGAVAAHKLAGSVADGVGPGRDRLPFQVAPEILRQLAGCLVPPLGLLAKRLQDDGVQVAAQGRAVPPFGGLAGSNGLRLADGLHDRRERFGVHLVRPPARQQLVEQDAQGVDVAGGRHRLTLDLFGARVIGRHHRDHGRGRCQVGLGSGREQLGDAEVDQLRDAVTVDQHVRRLDVAVDHQVLVGILDGRADDPEQRHALRGRRRARGAVLGDRLPLHVLHHQVGLARVGRAAVEHGGDVGMLEARQDLSLQEEAPLEVLGVAPAADQLQRDGLAEHVIVAHGPVDRAHAAVADAGFEVVRTDHPSDIRVDCWIRRRVAAPQCPSRIPAGVSRKPSARSCEASRAATCS